MFTNKKNYQKLLNVTDLNLIRTDKHTFADFEVVKFVNSKNSNDDSWIYLEIWTDENEIKICETDEIDMEEISSELSDDILNHINNLVNTKLEELAKWNLTEVK
ncbi:hypothetical protein EEO29_02595 [Staphylococcus pseudintermedius]|uniref:Uncharacterized protein n=1 Tax=Staphylococcus pseudintermedius TaxID=283734 RepID=A0A8H9BWZ1_STAPS|nr:hypothetical protein [Staphylococcus pseudintermedius]EGQ1665038.1 hypothetical protein [Staphylococcus pseudintermedius]EGQ1687243.1 hypothetical protein [Staphylococcus pseudintermedius]EGQ2814571.1 hypothetical protein [Staphylococcus pseudintermedius]EGQ2828792.1 hypothetical protein [Staphylococcus pseudintermedius]EGQ3150152.1 hypothetical protein [Staphylococcus pseudintermedius]